MTIALITTGGTIVSQRASDTQLAAPVLGGNHLLDAARQFGEIGEVEVHDAFKIASPQISLEHWRQLHDLLQAVLQQPHIEGAVVSHGTATLEETAWFLDLTLNTAKPVVLTGAQRNASEPDTDGPRNLFGALLAARAAQGRNMGVMVALNERLHAAREVTKNHTLNVETFMSGDWGCLGQIRAGRVVFHRQPLRRLHVPLGAQAWPQVPIVPMYVGACGGLVRAAADLGARGIVIEATASGHVNAAMHDGIVDVLQRGIPVLLSTRIPNGGTRSGYSFTGSSHTLLRQGAVLSDDLSPCKARILLMLALQQGWTQADTLNALYAQDRCPTLEAQA